MELRKSLKLAAGSGVVDELRSPGRGYCKRHQQSSMYMNTCLGAELRPFLASLDAFSNVSNIQICDTVTIRESPMGPLSFWVWCLLLYKKLDEDKERDEVTNLVR